MAAPDLANEFRFDVGHGGASAAAREGDEMDGVSVARRDDRSRQSVEVAPRLGGGTTDGVGVAESSPTHDVRTGRR